MKYFIRSVTISFLITVIQAQPTHEINISSGLADIPVKEWNDWQKSISNTEYTPDRFALIFGCELEYFYEPNKSINLEISRLTYSSTLKTIDPDNSNTGEIFSLTNNYNFITLPVSLGLKYYLPVRTNVYFTLKCDYYYTNVITRTEIILQNPFESLKERHVDNGNGYGYEIGIGFKPLVNNYFILTTEFLYKYADGMAYKFSNGTISARKIGSPKIEFTGIYFNIRLGRKL